MVLETWSPEKSSRIAQSCCKKETAMNIYGIPCGNRYTCSCGESWVSTYNNKAWEQKQHCDNKFRLKEWDGINTHVHIYAHPTEERWVYVVYDDGETHQILRIYVEERAYRLR